MVEQVEEFGPEFGAPVLGEIELFEDASVQVLESRTVEQPRRTRPEHPYRRYRKRRRIDEESSGADADQLRWIRRRSRERVANTVCAALVIAAGLALVGRRHRKRRSRLERDDRIQLPATDHPANRTATAQNLSALADRQVP